MKSLARVVAPVLLVNAGVFGSQIQVCPNRSAVPLSPAPREVSPVKDISFEKLPDFFLYPRVQDYKVDPYLEVASQLQKMGKKEALETLKKTAKNGSDSKLHVDALAILARMLFSAKPEGKFRVMYLSQLWDYYGGTSEEDWPLRPIEIIDGVPFLIVRWPGILGGAFPEATSKYLDYCIENCDWSAIEFKSLNAEQKKNALNKLIASKKWKVPLTDEEKKIFESQIK